MMWRLLALVLLLALSGCAASQSQPRLAVALPPVAQPADESATLDVQQLTGQIVAGVQAELSSRIETAVETTLRAEVQATGIGGDATGYRSEFGVGATLVVSLTLLLALILSHRREVLRIRQSPQSGVRGLEGCAPRCSSQPDSSGLQTPDSRLR